MNKVRSSPIQSLKDKRLQILFGTYALLGLNPISFLCFVFLFHALTDVIYATFCFIKMLLAPLNSPATNVLEPLST